MGANKQRSTLLIRQKETNFGEDVIRCKMVVLELRLEDQRGAGCLGIKATEKAAQSNSIVLKRGNY
jgi:hypothetical protein